MNADRFEYQLTVEHDNDNAIDLLTAALGLSRRQLKLAMTKGALWLKRKSKQARLRRATRELRKGDQLLLCYDARTLAAEPEQARLIADEDAYSVWYKPAGMLSQGSKWGDHCAITRWAEKTLQPQRPTFLVHRLDRDAAGLMLLAHQQRAAAALSELFQKRDIEKGYRVLVHGQFPTGPAVTTCQRELDGRAACSYFTSLAYDPERGLSLLDVRIDTGRKHQIRRHLSMLGFPVAGDRFYGRNPCTPGDEQGLQLTAYLLAFQCPLKQAPKRYQLPEELLEPRTYTD